MEEQVRRRMTRRRMKEEKYEEKGHRKRGKLGAAGNGKQLLKRVQPRLEANYIS